MDQPLATQYTISDFLEWEATRQLVIAPKFQRRDVWVPKAKSYLIDTILRSFPIPPLFIRLRIDPAAKRAIREVVDGQQRLRAVLGYLRGEFPVLAVHNAEFGGQYYSNLPEEVQRHFLGYKFAVNVLQEVSDAEVLNIFARINTYTVRLNDQELRNASFFGAFKQTVYSLANQHYAFWRNNNILSDMQLMRMMDAELASELVVSMLDGIRQTKAADLRVFYTKYDDSFPEASKISGEFENVINLIGNLLGEKLRTSVFRRMPLFYSLFCALYDGKYGLPSSKQPRITLTATSGRLVTERLMGLDSIISAQNPPDEYAEFISATKLSTADVGKRLVRHKVLWEQALDIAISPS